MVWQTSWCDLVCIGVCNNIFRCWSGGHSLVCSVVVVAAEPAAIAAVAAVIWMFVQTLCSFDSICDRQEQEGVWECAWEGERWEIRLWCCVGWEMCQMLDAEVWKKCQPQKESEEAFHLDLTTWQTLILPLHPSTPRCLQQTSPSSELNMTTITTNVRKNKQTANKPNSGQRVTARKEMIGLIANRVRGVCCCCCVCNC